ncbi:hypothetical protein UFOVP1648_5 [uncultured Caudovirales phage]|uniref:Uncharacterized protein n=1 Tax=uncultured Caudovirales phage TaxID=2100421 RepID=A0A6J5T334_9CAUD|nr:hypothetical protein UFOVP1648_5 [uncultured Caudovirales phage]
MAIYLNNNVGIKLATAAAATTPSIDISSYVTAATLTQIFDEIEVTTMGDLSHRVAAGLQSATFSVDFLNDWAAASVMTTLNAAIGTTLAVSVITVKGTAVSATNPSYQFSIFVNNLTPIGSGGVADEAASSLSFTVNSVVTVSTTVAF